MGTRRDCIADKENMATGYRTLNRRNQIKLERQYRKINRDVRKIKDSGMPNVIESSRALRSKLGVCNKLSRAAFESVSQKCIECDSEYFVLASETNKVLVKSLELNSKVFDPNIFAEKLITLISPELRVQEHDEDDVPEIDFQALGQKYSHIIRTGPRYEFINGTFDPGQIALPSKRAKQPRRLLEAGDRELKRPRKMDGSEVADEVKNGKEIEHLYSQIEQLYRREENPLPFFKLFVNPESYSATIENIFHSAFLVKEGQIKIKLRGSGDVKIPVIKPAFDEKPESSQRSQSILSFSMDDWREWCRRYEIDKPLLPSTT